MAITCKNCSHVFDGVYCPQCGQPAKTGAFTLTYLLHEVPHSVFHVDKGFLYTFGKLLRNPGAMLKEYLAGKRVRHFKPFAYVVIMSTLCTVLMPLIERATIEIFLARNPGYKANYQTLFWERYISLLIFLMIPILSVITWLTFQTKPYNYWEHFVANTYLGAQLNILLLFIKLFGFGKMLMGYHPAVNFTGFMFGFAAYYFYSFWIWMSPHRLRWRTILVLLLMNMALSLVFLTGFSFTGLMVPWWRF